MKYLPLVSVILWITIITGYIFAKNTFILPLVKFPALILLSIFLAVSFWNLQSAKKKLHAIAMLTIFIINNAVLVYGITSNYSTLESLLNYNEGKIEPELAELLVKGGSERERREVGRIIFQKHGIALPFKTDDELYALYVPTQADKNIFVDSHDRNYQVIIAKQNLSNEIVTSFFLIALQVTIFFVLLSYLLLFDKPLPTVWQEQ